MAISPFKISSFSRCLLFLCAIALTNALPWAGPPPTPSYDPANWTPAPTSSPSLERRTLPNNVCGFIGGNANVPALCSIGSSCVWDTAQSIVGCAPNTPGGALAVFTECFDHNSGLQSFSNPYAVTCPGNEECYQNTYPNGFHQFGCGASTLATQVATEEEGQSVVIILTSVDWSSEMAEITSTIIRTSTSTSTSFISTSSSTSSSSSSSTSSSPKSPTSQPMTPPPVTDRAHTSSSAPPSGFTGVANPANEATPVTNGRSKTGVIIGGTFGGVGGAILFIAIFVWFQHRRTVQKFKEQYPSYDEKGHCCDKMAGSITSYVEARGNSRIAGTRSPSANASYSGAQPFLPLLAPDQSEQRQSSHTPPPEQQSHVYEQTTLPQSNQPPSADITSGRAMQAFIPSGYTPNLNVISPLPAVSELMQNRAMPFSPDDIVSPVSPPLHWISMANPATLANDFLPPASLPVLPPMEFTSTSPLIPDLPPPTASAVEMPADVPTIVNAGVRPPTPPPRNSHRLERAHQTQQLQEEFRAASLLSQSRTLAGFETDEPSQMTQPQSLLLARQPSDASQSHYSDSPNNETLDRTRSLYRNPSNKTSIGRNMSNRHRYALTAAEEYPAMVAQLAEQMNMQQQDSYLAEGQLRESRKSASSLPEALMAMRSETGIVHERDRSREREQDRLVMLEREWEREQYESEIRRHQRELLEEIEMQSKPHDSVERPMSVAAAVPAPLRLVIPSGSRPRSLPMAFANNDSNTILKEMTYTPNGVPILGIPVPQKRHEEGRMYFV